MPSTVFTHSGDNLTVAQFYDKYNNDLPKVIVVTQGYCGDIGLEEFSIGQVIRVQTISTQKRIVAKVEKGLPLLAGRELSIPLEYDMKFCIVKGGKKSGRDVTLGEILEKHSLPVEVTPSDSSQLMNIEGQERETGKSCTLQLETTYEDCYLLGNAVADGMVFAQVTAVPVYLPDLRLSLANGIEGFNESQWNESLQNMANKVSQNVKFKTDFGNPNVAVYSSASSKTTNEYEDIKYRTPTEYYNMDDIILQKITNRPSKLMYIEQSHDTYDFIPADSVKKIPPPKAPKPVPEHSETTRTSSVVSVKPLAPPPAVPARHSQAFPSNKLASAEQYVSTTKHESKKPDIDNIKIEELGIWLKKLKLDKYVQMFLDQGIDGVVLKELRKEDLQKDFGMTTVESIKLIKFAQSGHVPT